MFLFIVPRRLFIYTDEKAAKKAYRKIVKEWTGDVVKIPVIGTESYANLTVDIYYGVYLMDIAWRDDETVMEIAYFAVRKPDTDEMVKLAQGIQQRLELATSPIKTNGIGKIAFISNGKIDVVNWDGSGRTCIATHNPTSFAFSPDGRKIAFTSTTGGCREVGEKKAACEYDNEIYIVKNNGMELSVLVEAQASSPVWSPDGKKLLFETIKIAPYSNNVSYFLDVVNSDGSGQKELNEMWYGNFAWSPDGKIITFSCPGPHNVGVCTIKPDGSGLAILTDNKYSDVFIQWSPDGKKILFESYREEGGYGLYSMDSDGGNPVKLIQKQESIWDEQWSPDGKKIAYVYRYFTNIYSINADGSGETQLTDQPASDVCPKWSPDGKKIAFISQRNGPREIFLMNDNGSDQKYLVTMGGEYNYCPVWVPE